MTTTTRVRKRQSEKILRTVAGGKLGAGESDEHNEDDDRKKKKTKGKRGQKETHAPRKRRTLKSLERERKS
jgi:hypothetical protein